jgi:hypothetical protein
LSFDALRSALDGVDGYILVLDTKGVNVWCAAGKGTFGTDELIHRIDATGLREVVKHRKLILPQLGAPGIIAHDIKRKTHFKVEYGPVRADDLKEYLAAGKATAEMRKVNFPLWDRIVLIPVDFVRTVLPLLVAFLLLWLLLNPLAAWGALAAVLTGAVLFPILLPWLPTRQFSIKGYFLGALVAIPFAVLAFQQYANAPAWVRVVSILLYLLAIPTVSAYLGFNFTGSTPLVSKTAVEREMARYIRIMIAMGGISILFVIGLILFRFLT